jgi:hypothetical protein
MHVDLYFKHKKSDSLSDTAQVYKRNNQITISNTIMMLNAVGMYFTQSNHDHLNFTTVT